MIKKLIVLYWLLAVLLPSMVQAKTRSKGYVVGEGRFYSEKEDRLSFIKKQLLVSAFRDVISKELTRMKLDVATFWQKYDEKFEEAFSTIDEKLKEKYKINETSKVKPAVLKKYQKYLRKKRLVLKAKFGKPFRVIKSYKVKKISRSPTVPNSRYMNILAKVNKKRLKQFYYKYYRNSDELNYERLYISTDFHLNEMTWKDVGVVLESDFSAVVTEHWKKWFKGNLQGIVNEVSIVGKQEEQKLSGVLANYNLSKEVTLNDTDENDSSVDVTNNNNLKEESLWLRINISLKKTWEDSLLKRRSISFSGEFIFIDLATNRIVGHGDIEEKIKKFNINDEHKLSSKVASTVYTLPLYLFKQFPTKLEQFPKGIKQAVLKIENLSSARELLEFNDILVNQGTSIRLNSSIKSLEEQIGYLAISYSGVAENFKKIIQGLDGMNITQKEIKYENENENQNKNEFKFTLVQKLAEDVKEQGSL